MYPDCGMLVSLSGRLKFTVRRHKFNKDSLFLSLFRAEDLCSSLLCWFGELAAL